MKIVLLTCDEYRWLVPVFSYFLKKYWPDNPYEVEIVTESEHIDGDAVYYAGKSSWSSMLIKYLKQSKEDKILLIVEDYLFKSTVNTARVKTAEKFCEGNVGCVRLGNCPHKYFKKHTVRYSHAKGFREYSLEHRFSTVIHIAFFQRQFLLDILKKGENVWQAENNGAKRLRKMESKWRVLWPEANIIDYLHVGGLIRKGKLRPQALKWVLSDLSKSGRPGKEIRRIINDRVLQEKGQAQHTIYSDTPWFHPDSVEYLSNLIQPEWSILETGSGSSTIWFAKRAKKVISFEHSEKWYDRVKELIEVKGIKNVDLRLLPGYPKRGIWGFKEYEFDFISIDGKIDSRVRSVRDARLFLKPGGYLLLDNTEYEKYAEAITLLDSWESVVFGDSEGQTTIWRKPMYEAVWIQRFETDRRQGKTGDYYIALVPGPIPGEEENVIASFKDYNDAVVFGEIKAEKLGLLLINFLRENTREMRINE